MTFEDFLRRRRLDVAAFRAAEPVQAAQWEALYGVLHPDSFLAQVKMVLNDVRRRYHLAEAPAPASAPPATAGEGAAPRPAGLRPDRRARPIGPVTDISILPVEADEPMAELAVPAAPLPSGGAKPSSAESESAEAAPARPARPRAVIWKPAAAPDTLPPPELVAPAPLDAAPEAPAETPLTEAPTEMPPTEMPPARLARPRAVIRRPPAAPPASPAVE